MAAEAKSDTCEYVLDSALRDLRTDILAVVHNAGARHGGAGDRSGTASRKR